MKKLPILFLIFCWIAYADVSAKDRDPPTILVTCASGELGSAIAKYLALENHLILAGRDRMKLEVLQQELSSQHPHKYEIAIFDYMDQASLINFGHEMENKMISGLVLITPRPAFGNDLFQDKEKWEQLFQSTFIGPVEVLKYTVPHLTSRGKIVVIGGITSAQLNPDFGSFCIIRRMWTTYAKALSHRLGPKGICINVLSPGVVLTNFHTDRISRNAEMNAIDFESQLEEETANIPLRRHADPREIAKSVQFLLSRDSDFITGVNLLIDGGMTLSY